MTYVEAIETLPVARLTIKGNPNVVDEEFDRYSQAIDLSISALEKQIPKKPKRLGTTNYFACPTCTQGLLLNMGCMNNCCRQAIDWSDNQ